MSRGADPDVWQGATPASAFDESRYIPVSLVPFPGQRRGSVRAAERFAPAAALAEDSQPLIQWNNTATLI